MNLELLFRIDRLLGECPFGAVNGKIVTSRTTNEADLAAWIVRVHDLAIEFHQLFLIDLAPFDSKKGG